MAEIQQLENAFKKAHAAGDSKAAGALAREIKRLRSIEANQENEAQAIGTTLSNIPSDAYETGAGMLSAVGGGIKKTFTDPIGAATSVGNAVGTGLGVVAGGVMNASDMAFGPGSLAMSDRDRKAQEMASQFGANMKDKYWDNLGQTVQEHPVQTALDASAVLAGGAGLAGRGPMALNGATKVARIPGQTRASEALLRWSAPKPGSLDKLGSEAMLLDASPSLTGIAQGVVAKPGPYSDQLVDALTTRHEGRSDRLLHGTQNTLGRLRDPVRLKTGIDKATQRAAGPFYRWAKQNAPDLTGQLDNMLARELTTPASGMAQDGRKVMFSVMDDIDDALMAGDPRLTAQRLHDIRKNLDARIVYGEQATQALSSADKAAQGPLKKARKAVDKILKENMPGFKEGDAITATGKKAMDDVNFGFNAIDGGKSAMFPETFALEYAKRDPKWVREGLKSRIANALGTKANDTSALKQVVGDGNDFNRKKLVKVLGQKDTDEIVNLVDTEQLFGQNFSDVARNSQTAKRQAALKAIEGPDAPYIDQGATVTGLAARGVSKGLNALLARGMSKYSSKNSEALAKALSLKGKDAQDFVAELAKSKTPGDFGRKFIKALVAAQGFEMVNRQHR